MYLLFFLAGAILCWLIDYVIWSKKLEAQKLTAQSLQNDLTAEREKKANLESSLASAESGLQSKTDELAKAGEELTSAKKDAEAMTEKLTAVETEASDAKGKAEELAQNIAALEEKAAQLESSEAALKEKTEALEQCSTKLSELEAAKTALEEQLAAVPAAAAQPDDLRKIEGIGPKIAELLNADGIESFAQLAATSTDRLKEILEAAGSRFRMADPATWPAQAELAAKGDWDALQTLQDELDGGRAAD